MRKCCSTSPKRPSWSIDSKPLSHGLIFSPDFKLIPRAFENRPILGRLPRWASVWSARTCPRLVSARHVAPGKAASCRRTPKEPCPWRKFLWTAVATEGRHRFGERAQHMRCAAWKPAQIVSFSGARGITHYQGQQRAPTVVSARPAKAKELWREKDRVMERGRLLLWRALR